MDLLLICQFLWSDDYWRVGETINIATTSNTHSVFSMHIGIKYKTNTCCEIIYSAE